MFNKLSVITINLNNLKGLEETIKSVIIQNTQDFEFIIIDGASTDGSVALIERLAVSDKRLVGVTNDDKEFSDIFAHSLTFSPTHQLKWCSEPDTGIYNAMNKGIKMAKGEYLLFLNSGDCFYDENVVKDFYSLNPTADVVSGNLEVIIDDEKRVMYAHNGESFTLDYFYPCNTLPHQATFIKRDCFSKYGLYDETLRIASDWMFFVKLLVINRGSYHYFNRLIAQFDNQGISSQFDNKSLIDKETSDYFKSLMTSYVFDSYDKLYREKEMYKKHYNDAIEYKNLKGGDFSFIIKFLLWVKSLKKTRV